MKISVTMPAFNVEHLVGRAVRSVLGQSETDFELIICDDASTDGTWEALQEFAPDPRVRLLQVQENLGLGGVRQWIVAHARGKYMAICDADDELQPGTLERFSRILDERPTVGVVYGDLWVVETENDGRELGPRRRQSFSRLEEAWDLMSNIVPNGGTLARLELVRQVGGYRDLRACEDWDLWLRLAEITEFHYEHEHVASLWRRRPGSQTRCAAALFQENAAHVVREAALRRSRS